MREQIAHYKAQGFPETFGNWWTGLIVRRGTNPAYYQGMDPAFGDAWMGEMTRWVYHDQISLPYLLWKWGIRPVDLPQGWLMGKFGFSQHGPEHIMAGARGMKVLVSGGLGFIGSHLAESFFNAGHDITVLDVADQYAPIDARDYFRHMNVRYDLVIHAAAVVGGRRVIEWTPLDHAQNLEIDAALFAWAQRTKPGRVVYFSSSCAYPVHLATQKRRLRETDIDLRRPGVARRAVRLDEAHRRVAGAGQHRPRASP